MAKYCVNKKAQANGDHEVHTNCNYLPDAQNQLYLGEFSNCHDAVREAKKHYHQVNGCFFCCNPCHTQ
jgi:hypothetical protein